MTQLEKWTRLAEHWEEQGPPATPSTEDVYNMLTILRQYLKTSRPTIAILGCTPSLRRRLADDWPDAHVLLIDFCEKMYLATSSAMTYVHALHEQYIALDWLEMGRYLANKVDAFIGDKSLDNVPKHQWLRFFRSAATCLRRPGILILHVGFPDPHLAGKPFTAIAKPWVESLTLADNSLKNAAAGLWEDLLSGSAKWSSEYLSLEPYRNDLEAASRSTGALGALSQRILEDFASQLDASWVNFDHDDVVSTALHADLRHVDTKYSHDYHAAPSQPILTFRITG